MRPGSLQLQGAAARVLLLAATLAGCASPGPTGDRSSSVPQDPSPARTGVPAVAEASRDPDAAPAPGLDPEVLERREGLRVQGRIEPGEPRRFAVHLEEGEYLEIRVRPDRLDARVELFAPGDVPESGGVEAAAEGEHTPELTGQVVWTVARESGLHRLRVEPTGEEAVELLLELRALRPAGEEDLSRARCRREVEAGWELRQSGRIEEALERLDSAEELCEAAGYLSGVGAARVQRASSLTQGGRLEEARRERQAAVAVYRELGDALNEFWNLLQISNVDSFTGRWESARRRLDEASRLSHELGKPHLEARVVCARCVLLNQQRSISPALEVCGNAVERLRATGQRSYLAQALTALGRLRYSQGDLDAAREVMLEAVEAAEETGNERLVATLRHDLALVSLAEGDFDQALASYQDVLELYRAQGQRSHAANVLSHMGDLHERMGNLDSALDYFRTALEEARELGRTRPQIQMLLNLGEVLQQLGDLEGARGHFERALALSLEVGDPQHRASAFQRMGALHLARGEPGAARELLRQALDESREADDLWRRAVVLTELARAHAELGEPEEALRLLADASSLSRRLGDRKRLAESHYQIARIQWTTGDARSALESVDRALELAEAMRPLLGGEDLRALFSATTRPFHELRIALLMERSRRDPAGPGAAEALRESERARARSLLEILAESEMRPSSDLPRALLDEQVALQERLHAAEAERRKLLGEGEADGVALARASVEIEGLLTELRQLERRMRAESPRYASLTATEPVTLDAIQETVLDPDTTLLEYWLGEEGSFLWAVTDREFRSYRLPRREEIEADARCLHWLVSAFGEPPPAGELPDHGAACLGGRATPYLETAREGHPLQARSSRRELLAASWRERAARLSETLLAPAARDGLLGRRLAVVSDGALEYVPFAALPAPLDPGEHLVRGHELVRLASASVLAFQRSRDEAASEGRGVLAVFADPVYSTDDRRLAAATRGPSRGIPSAGDSSAADLSFRRLDFAGREAEAIASLVPPERALLARGPDASRETVLTTDLSGYRYVHFAAHGVIDTQYPQLSGLVLSLVDQQGSWRENGFLRLHDVYGMDLEGVDTVVLSACETALGREIRGEGLVGLTRGFLYAGAERVVASLWPVQDLATARLMEELYTQLLRRGRSPGEALRQAQTTLLDDPDAAFDHPYYWAGFVLQGDWR